MSIFKHILSWSLHIVAIGLIIFFFWPIASWYYNYRPILGVDFYHTVTYAHQLTKNLELLPRAFNYFTYGGVPHFLISVASWWTPITILAKFYPLIASVKLSVLAGFFLLYLGTYFGTYVLSKNHGLSLLLSVLVAYTANIYGSAVWGGSLPYSLNQLFFPVILGLCAFYLKNGSRRIYFLLILVMGWAMLGHLVNAAVFMLPSAALLLLIGQRTKKTPLIIRFLEALGMFVGAYLLAYRITIGMVSGFISEIFSGNILNPFGFGNLSSAKVSLSSNGVAVGGDSGIVAFERSRFDILFTDTHYLLFVLFGTALVIGIIAFVIAKKKRRVWFVVPWSLLAGYSVVHVFLNAYGFTFLSQAWYRAHWHFAITLSFAIAALFGYVHETLFDWHRHLSKIFYVSLLSASGAVLIFLNLSGNVQTTIDQLATRLSPASAHPEAINLIKNDEALDEVKKLIAPEWMDPNNRNYNLYTTDAQVNVWWNALFDMPLVRGYLDPPTGSGHSGNNFLLDQAIGGDGLVTNFKYSPESAKNMALYYIDWYAVKYAEGGHLSKSPNKGPSTYLKDSILREKEIALNGALILYETASGKPEIYDNVPQYLKFYEFKDELVSPIVVNTTAPAVLCICNWSAYESVTKILSMHNINSQFLTTAFWDRPLDELSIEDLQSFDALILSNYSYRSKTNAFSKIEKYLTNGGKVFFDTGGEVAESKSDALPEFLPFDQTARGGLGTDWNLQAIAGDIFLEGVQTEEFAALKFGDAPWNISYPQSGVSSAEVILSQGDKPILTRSQVGQGVLVWSGLNLPYHVQYYTNIPESLLFLNILKSFVPLKQNAHLPITPEFKSGRVVDANIAQSTKGVLLKYQMYPGWHVRVDGKTLKAYLAGPTSPGFIYVPFVSTSAQKLVFSYDGNPQHHFIWVLQWSMIVLLTLCVIFGDGFFRTITLRIFAHVGTKTHKWWEKEEE